MEQTKKDPLWETISCQVCGEKENSTVFTISFGDLVSKNNQDVNFEVLGATADTELSYVKCKECATIYTNPRLTDEGNRRFYNEFKENVEEFSKAPIENSVSANVGSARYTYKMFNAFADLELAAALSNKVSSSRKKPALKLLDYGCGYGYLLRLSKVFGIDAKGVELSQLRIAECRALGLTAGTADQILGDEKYDIVISQSVIEHSNRLDTYIENIAMSLEKGGVFLCNGLYVKTIEIEQNRGRYKLVHPISHLTMFTKSSLRKFLNNNGFRIPGRIELAKKLRNGGYSWYNILPFLIYGAIRVSDADIHAISIRK